MGDHTGIGENDVPQTPKLIPHIQFVHMLAQVWKECVMHMQWAFGYHLSLHALNMHQAHMLMHHIIALLAC